MKINSYLNAMVKYNASDLYLTTGAKASVKVQGGLKHITNNRMSPGIIAVLAKDLMTDDEWVTFRKTKEMNKGVAIRDVGRFRVNAYHQRGEVSMVIRHVRSEIMPPEKLGLPDILKSLMMKKEGLLLFVGSTGAGKSTSMASLIQYRNERHAGHMLTIEDPIEFVFRHDKSIIGQREVGFDTLSYASAMREAMREAPDVIMVGEVRDTETVEAVMGFADTGHLVITTLHATSTTQALDRLLHLFSPDHRQRVLMDLSLNLRGVVAQRLVKGIRGQLVLATEVLVNTPFISEVIRSGETQQLKDLIEKGAGDGMYSFDQSLASLYKNGDITKEEAVENATSRNNLEWRLNFDEQAETNSQLPGNKNSAVLNKTNDHLPALEI